MNILSKFQLFWFGIDSVLKIFGLKDHLINEWIGHKNSPGYTGAVYIYIYLYIFLAHIIKLQHLEVLVYIQR